jgi:hypothetical protein
MRRLALLTILTAVFAIPAFAQSGPYQYFPLTPCRAVDTRSGAPFSSDTVRSFQMRGVCGVPTTAKAVSLNVTITQATAPSFLTVWPSGTTRPVVSMINFEPSDPALGNGIIVGVSTNPQDLSVYNNFGNVHVIIDVTGYFQ